MRLKHTVAQPLISRFARVFLMKNVNTFKSFVVGTHWERLNETLPMSIHNICFLGDLRGLELLINFLSRVLR